MIHTMILYSYVCPSHGEFTAFSSIADREKPKDCPKCGVIAAYKVSAPMFKLPGWDTSWPTAASKWERFHEKEGKKEPK